MTTTETKNKLFTNPIFIAVAALLCCALWGSATPFIKIGYELILPERNVPSTLLFAGIRFTLAGLLTVMIYSVAKRRLLFPKKENYGRVLTVSAFQTVIQYVFFYIGLSVTSGVKGTVISGSNAFFAILISALIFRQENLNLKKIIACILGFAGIIVVNLNGLDFTMNYGDAFVMISNIAYAVSSVLIKRFSKCVGETPYSYMKKLKIRTALVLRSSGATLEEAAQGAGYSDASALLHAMAKEELH